jgi:hypothetical protein
MGGRGWFEFLQLSAPRVAALERELDELHRIEEVLVAGAAPAAPSPPARRFCPLVANCCQRLSNHRRSVRRMKALQRP